MSQLNCWDSQVKRKFTKVTRGGKIYIITRNNSKNEARNLKQLYSAEKEKTYQLNVPHPLKIEEIYRHLHR